MKCPFKFNQEEQQCDEDCALLVGNIDNGRYCSFAINGAIELRNILGYKSPFRDIIREYKTDSSKWL